MNHKIHFICNNNVEAKHACRQYQNQYGQIDVEKAKTIVTLGGDGLFLKSIQKYQHLHKPFFGINFGKTGFLLNPYNPNMDLQKQINDAQCTYLPTLRTVAIDYQQQVITKYSLNDIHFMRKTAKLLKLILKINNVRYISHFMGDGIIVANPVGTTAYNRAAHGRILPLSANLLHITPICAFRPGNWYGAIIPNDAVINIEIQNNIATSGNLYIDNLDLGPIKSVQINQSNAHQIQILLIGVNTMANRLLNAQFYTCQDFIP